jgi:hypothetical protein
MGGGLVLGGSFVEMMDLRVRVEDGFEHGSAETGEGK